MTLKDFSNHSGEQLLTELEQYCAEIGASDIHASPEKEDVRIEVRLNGLLQKIATLSHAEYEAFLRRIKFASKLKLNITDMPQDGQYTFQAPGRTVNIRVATLPSQFGETVTLRLLDPKHGIITLAELGFPPEMENELKELVKLPHGLVLVTGPTGSGKTTTLYALLQTIIGTARNIITLEDPVEYEIPGIVQSEINSDHGYTFASGLRSVLRHDPNVILVGEIRDLETAQTAIDAALTGHLVLSTLHTNDAPSTISRMVNMGIEPFLVATSVNLIQAQRLIRRICKDCKEEVNVPVEGLIEIGFSPEDAETVKSFRGKGCQTCNGTGFKGRVGLYEVMEINDELRELIIIGASAIELRRKAIELGMITLRESGLYKLREGITTIEEVVKETVL